MKKQEILMLVLCAMMFTGCSRDSIEEPEIETTNLEMNRSNFGTDLPNRQEVVMEESGTYQMVRPTACNPTGVALYQMDMEGINSDWLLGDFKTTKTNCTNLKTRNFIEGKHVSVGSGDTLFFYSEKSGNDGLSDWSMYTYTGGTGKFEGVTGEVKFYVMPAGAGQYKVRGEGYLSFPK